MSYIVEVSTQNGTLIARSPIMKPFTERWFREKLKKLHTTPGTPQANNPSNNIALEPLKQKMIGKYTSETLWATGNNSSNYNNNTISFAHGVSRFRENQRIVQSE